MAKKFCFTFMVKVRMNLSEEDDEAKLEPRMMKLVNDSRAL